MRNFIDIVLNESAAPEVHGGAPEIGVKFSYKGKAYAVVGWMTELREPGVFGKRGGKLIACNHDKATWVVGIGGGGPGTVAPINAIQITGSANWSEEQYRKVVNSAMAAAANKQTLTKPV